MKIGPGEVVALTGYRGDNAVRIIRVEKLTGTLITGHCLLRSSPAQPVYRSYILEHVGGFKPVTGFCKAD